MRGSWKLAAAIGAVAVVVVMAGRMVLPDPAPDDVDGWIRSWLGVGLEKQAAGELQREVERDPRNLDAHYRLITLQAGGMQEQPSLEELYTRLAADEDPELADIGRYGLGLLISAGGGDPAEALAHFETVRDRELPYLNNSIGRCLQLLDRRVEAARYFERELELGGNVTGASYNLALNLIELGELDELARRATEDESFRAHIGSSLRREVALWQGDVLRYLGLMVRGTFESVNVPGLLAAVLILGIWLVFLRGLDVFEPERLHALAITLGLGMGAGIVCAIPYDLVHLVLGLSPDDSVSGSLTYCVLVVGLIEETIKLVPLLVVIRWTGWVDEPVDVAIYGATSALGFAFVENLMYFDPDQLVSIHARAFSATVLHMALTTIAAYGLILARGREQTRARTVRVALGWFMVAVVVHGLYDFVLLGPGAVALLRPLALVILLLVTLAFVAVLSLIADLDRSREGFLTVDQQPLFELRDSMGGTR